MGEKELSLVFFPLFRMSLYVNLTLNNNNNNNNNNTGVLQFLDSGELICLQQGEKTRPIGKSVTYRKIADVAMQKPHREDLQNYFFGHSILWCSLRNRADAAFHKDTFHPGNREDTFVVGL